MSHLTEVELHRMRRVASDMAEVFAERGHRVDSAMEVDPAFGSGWSRSSLARDLAIEAASEAASRYGLDFRVTIGGGREFRSVTTVDKRFRFKKAVRNEAGGFDIKVNNAASGLQCDDALIPEEHWVFAYALTKRNELTVVFAAPILDIEMGFPGRYVLGPIEQLLTPREKVQGFVPADEELDGFEEVDDSDDVGDV